MIEYRYDNLSNGTTFEKIHAFTAYWERDSGNYTDSPIDNGGITKNGVTLGFLKGLNDKDLADVDKNGTINTQDVLAASPEIARELFHHEFWVNGNAYCCPPLTAMVYYDFSVNSGSGNAAYCLQKAINILQPGTIAQCAKNLGPLTRKSLTMFTDKSSDLNLAMELIKQRERYVREIVKKNPSQQGNLSGWCNRIRALQKLIIETALYDK